MLLLPLAGALLMLPSGSSTTRRWLGMYVAALFTVIFLPVVFGIAVDLGMVQPLARMGAHMQDALDQFTTAAEGLALPAGAEMWRVAQWQAWLESVPDSVLNALGGVVSILLGWLLSLAALIVGMLVGVYLLLNLLGLIGGFMGGAGGSAGAAFGLSRLRSGGTRVERGTHTIMNAFVSTQTTPPAALPAPPPGGNRAT